MVEGFGGGGVTVVLKHPPTEHDCAPTTVGAMKITRKKIVMAHNGPDEKLIDTIGMQETNQVDFKTTIKPILGRRMLNGNQQSIGDFYSIHPLLQDIPIVMQL